MQNVNLTYPHTSLQRVFVELGLELLYKDTIDTFRLRLHNPKTILEELISITQAVKENVLSNVQYVTEIAREAKSLLENSTDGLIFSTLSKKYFIDLLIKANKRENHYKIIQASKLILNQNNNYRINLVNSIEARINTFLEGSSLYTEIDDFIFQCQYLHIELVNMGYTKQYLYQFFRTIFIHAGDMNFTFDQRFQIWKTISRSVPSPYKTIYKILGSNFQYEELIKIDDSYEKVNKTFRATLPINTSDKVKNYLEINKEDKLISLKVDSLDHYKAVEISRSKLLTDLDLYHLGFSSSLNTIGPKVAVIGINDPSKASIIPSNYQIEGFIRSSKEVFDAMLIKVNRLRANNIQVESRNKLISAFHYLRSGSENSELEAKLLNYWIGIEYIFTLHENELSTIDRIKSYFPICHAVIYVKRNLHDFHKTLERLNVSQYVLNFNPNLDYLGDFNTYEVIKANTANPLLIRRANYFQQWVSDPSKIEKALFLHQNNLVWNISRLYRIRNEIVHNAAIKNNIYTNVSHIKYYLTFILNSILDYFSNIPIDINNDNEITIEDYFITQDVIFGALKGKVVRDYLQISNPLEVYH